ncbi:heavy metal sensor histidine kinase [Denitromonas iodatirespirans]|uniref:Sensor protein n=1 Tax=Denitromonas iodatirespirans TaxID=2795389 RepID=A0A944D9H6_DENI1|nr:heavy metal sensor histidine kinase [Denitromonas iodatirespirans]MBT0960478.1 heavy metal sensor histidine kinase [Denitromonas iodatirespirans]
MSRHASLTARLTLLFAAASSAVLLALGLVIGSAMERHFEEQDVDILSAKLGLIAHTLQQHLGAKLPEPLPPMLSHTFIGHEAMSVRVLDADQAPVFEAGDAHFPAMAPFPTSDGGDARPFVWTQQDTVYRGLATRITLPTQPARALTVAVAIDIAHHIQFMNAFSYTLWAFVLGAAALSGLLGWVAARRGLAPLAAVAARTASITAQRLDERLPDVQLPEELRTLVASLNAMLARLQEAFARLSDFSSDLAHELRTPISNLMTQTQVALSRERPAEDYREILASNAEEFERLSKMIADMLFLAKSEHGLVIPNREAVDLRAEMAALFDFYDALAEEKAIRLVMSGQASVTGDRLMLRRALSNLLSNAVRHASPGSTVDVAIETGHDGARVRVRNAGDTVPAEALTRVFERFYRADPARRHTSEGAGLGLAITRSIVLAHGGRIDADSADGATTFTIRLPASP